MAGRDKESQVEAPPTITPPFEQLEVNQVETAIYRLEGRLEQQLCNVVWLE